jgi:hypothetical protein
MKLFIHGASMFACFLIGVSFLRFWRVSRDRFFILFSSAFFLLGLERLIIAAATANGDELGTWLYLLRIMAFLMILSAVLDKNRKTS